MHFNQNNHKLLKKRYENNIRMKNERSNQFILVEHKDPPPPDKSSILRAGILSQETRSI